MSMHFGSRSPPLRGSRLAGPTRTPNCSSVPSSTRNVRVASGGTTVSLSSTPTMSACASTRHPWTCGKLRRCADTASPRSPILSTLSLISFSSGTCLKSAIAAGLKGASGWLRVARSMLLEGTSFDRETVGPIEVPQAEVEIDLDIESSADGRVYLWGFLLQYAGESGAVYHEFSQFDDLDNQSEAALASDAFTWLRSIVEATPSALVFHYSAYEVAKIIELARREHTELLDWAASYAEEHFVDLLEIVKAHYFGVSGLGLKLMARHVGFSWRDDDPGGLNSQLWFAEAVHGETAEVRSRARRRVLEYNEDDVTATSQVRAWLRAQ